MRGLWLALLGLVVAIATNGDAANDVSRSGRAHGELTFFRGLRSGNCTARSGAEALPRTERTFFMVPFAKLHGTVRF